MEVNDQAYALMETYPELIKYMDTSKGYITFTEEGITDINAGLLARSQMKQQELQDAKVAELNFQLSQLEKEAAKKTVSFSKLQLNFEERDFFNQQDFIDAQNNKDFSS